MTSHSIEIRLHVVPLDKAHRPATLATRSPAHSAASQRRFRRSLPAPSQREARSHDRRGARARTRAAGDDSATGALTDFDRLRGIEVLGASTEAPVDVASLIAARIRPPLSPTPAHYNWIMVCVLCLRLTSTITCLANLCAASALRGRSSWCQIWLPFCIFAVVPEGKKPSRCTNPSENRSRNSDRTFHV